jgi:hypothetical protein
VAAIEQYCAASVYDPPSYSQAIKVSGAQSILFLAGRCLMPLTAPSITLAISRHRPVRCSAQRGPAPQWSRSGRCRTPTTRTHAQDWKSSALFRTILGAIPTSARPREAGGGLWARRGYPITSWRNGMAAAGRVARGYHCAAPGLNPPFIGRRRTTERPRPFQASRVQYTSRHNGPLNGLKSNPRIEVATAKTACRIITGTTTTF